MSTRGTIGFIHNNNYKAVYNHSDSYPSGLGDEVVKFCKKVIYWPLFITNFERVRFVDGDYVPTPKEIEENKKWANLSVSEKKYEDLYCLLRGLQGSPTLNAIYAGEVTLLKDSSDFIKDGLFCEFGYVLNLDALTLEFYSGFQKEPQPGNRFGETTENSYYACKLVGSFPLTEIPENWEELCYKREEQD